MKTLAKVLLVLLLIALGILLLLFACAKIFNYGTIGNLLNHLFGQLGIMWSRIFG